MKAYVITIEGNRISETGWRNLKASSEKVGNEFPLIQYKATTPEEVPALLETSGLHYAYPTTEPRTDITTGLYLTPYETGKLQKRIACFYSHFRLWHECVDLDEPIIVLEHDAVFEKKFPLNGFPNTKYDIVALNNPLGATRKSQTYHQLISQRKSIKEVPWIDKPTVPQGLPGNSAYYIKPQGAKTLIELTEQMGVWPNDALMCKQLMPARLGCVFPYYTKIQGLPSTTTL